MAQLAVPNIIENGSSITAVQHRENYAAIQTWANAEALRRDGLTAMLTATELSIPSAPTTATGVANKAYVDASIPPGVIWDYTGLIAPSAFWTIPIGQLADIAANPILYGMYGTLFGAVVGAQFRLPDLRGMFVVGKGIDLWSDTLGEKGGSADAIAVAHTHTSQDHSHTSADHSHSTPDHSHGSPDHSHWFSAGTTGAGAHGHNIGDGAQLMFVQAGQPEGVPGPGSAGRSGGWQGAGDHAHSVSGNTNGASNGNSSYGASDGNTTWGANGGAGNTTGGADGAAGNTTNGQSPTAAGSLARLPPYIALTKILRLG